MGIFGKSNELGINIKHNLGNDGVIITCLESVNDSTTQEIWNVHCACTLEFKNL